MSADLVASTVLTGEARSEVRGGGGPRWGWNPPPPPSGEGAESEMGVRRWEEGLW